MVVALDLDLFPVILKGGGLVFDVISGDFQGWQPWICIDFW